MVRTLKHKHTDTYMYTHTHTLFRAKFVEVLKSINSTWFKQSGGTWGESGRHTHGRSACSTPTLHRVSLKRIGVNHQLFLASLSFSLTHIHKHTVRLLRQFTCFSHTHRMTLVLTLTSFYFKCPLPVCRSVLCFISSHLYVNVCKEWERQRERARKPNVPVTLLR